MTLHFNLQRFNDEHTEVVHPLLVMGTEGADDIGNTLKGATIKALGGNDTINVWNSSVTVDAGAGDDTILNWNPNVSIYGGSGKDSMESKGENAKNVEKQKGCHNLHHLDIVLQVFFAKEQKRLCF